ncbi:set and mynd domain-containing 3 [Fusarium longipes]|uniref:Set and mynd domain-containing 3 n=1 Tax=Fusarium longipes TaxID=694270 RepID=A0A395T296_9HYPO|nr:set and mynd domain-containing 3 [Fusarium longipes]
MLPGVQPTGGLPPHVQSLIIHRPCHFSLSPTSLNFGTSSKHTDLDLFKTIMATPSLPCANCDPDGESCQNMGRSSCKNCRLVVYCSSDCQKAHWPIHRIDCKSALGKETWTPNWALQNRTPAFIRGGIGVSFGGKKFLWGNVPALDILRLDSNEGEQYQDQLSLLFAASGDLRNLVKTVAQVPSNYDRPIDIVMNDRDLDIVARNTIILLLALTSEGNSDAIDCMIHIWYSAFIRKSDLDMVNQKVLPLIQEVCHKIKDKPANSILGKTWKFGQHNSLRLVLEKSSWERMLSFMKIPEGLTTEKANEIRTAVTTAESRVDYRDRSYLMMPPSHRIARYRYRQDGLLLPFGSGRGEFQQPNPTFFQNTESWSMHDNADPLNGWSMKEVEGVPTGPATSDIYGKLFHYVRSLLKKFLERISISGVTFELCQVDASDLPDHLEERTFDRIEVSNISDRGYLGIHQTVGIMSLLLRAPSVNPHATLITLFMNVVDENMTQRDQMADATPNSPSTKRLLKFLPPRRPPTSSNDPDIIKFSYARDYVRTYDHIFDRVSKMFSFSEFPRYIGVAIKEKNTIVEKWPFRLKLSPEQKGAKEEFDLMMRGGASGKELYLEWKRIAF